MALDWGMLGWCWTGRNWGSWCWVGVGLGDVWGGWVTLGVWH